MSINIVPEDLLNNVKVVPQLELLFLLKLTI